MSKKENNITVRRAALPEVLFASDIAIVLGIPESQAYEVTLRGRVGDHILVRGQPAVLRKDFIGALSKRSLGADAGKEVLDVL